MLYMTLGINREPFFLFSCPTLLFSSVSQANPKVWGSGCQPLMSTGRAVRQGVSHAAAQPLPEHATVRGNVRLDWVPDCDSCPRHRGDAGLQQFCVDSSVAVLPTVHAEPRSGERIGWGPPPHVPEPEHKKQTHSLQDD